MKLLATNDLGSNQYELVIKVEAEEFSAAVTDAFKKNSKKLRVDGFRPGKAPRHVIEKIYGKEVFYEDAVNATYPKAYSEAIKESGLEPVAAPELHMQSVTADGYEFTVAFYVKPDVTIENYRGITAEKIVRTVSDDDINTELDKLVKRNSRLVSIENRPAKLDDTVVIDFEGFKDGIPFDGGKAEAFELKLGSGQFIPGFEDQIAGKNTDEQFEINVTFPENYHAKELAGQPVVFRVKLHDIKEAEFPAIDDEFAKDVSEFDTLDDLKEDIRTKLQKGFDKQSEDDLENAIIDSIIKEMNAEIPEVMFEEQINRMVSAFEQRLASQGMNIQLYLNYSGMSMEAFRRTFQNQAERQVKVTLALQKIAELENIEITDEDVQNEMQTIADLHKIPLAQVQAYIPKENIVDDLKITRAVNIIKESASVSEKVFEKTEDNQTNE